jgi:hypothetical protein
MPPLKPGKIVNTKGQVVSAPVKKTESANVREDRTPPKPKGVQGAQTPSQRAAAPTASQIDALKATREQDKWENEQIKKVKNGQIKYVPTPTIVKVKKAEEEEIVDPGPGEIKEVVATPVETVVASTGLVDGVNYKEIYIDEIKRLVLSLITNAKSLLIRYNFSGIDRVPESYLDFDREAKTETLSSSFSRPESPFTLEQADLQDKFSTDLNEINNLISDLSNSAEKAKYFGSMRGGTFLPREVKLLRNGSVGYDMRLEFTSISNQDFVVKCYEVS